MPHTHSLCVWMATRGAASAVRRHCHPVPRKLLGELAHGAAPRAVCAHHTAGTARGQPWHGHARLARARTHRAVHPHQHCGARFMSCDNMCVVVRDVALALGGGCTFIVMADSPALCARSACTGRPRPAVGGRCVLAPSSLVGDPNYMPEDGNHTIVLCCRRRGGLRRVIFSCAAWRRAMAPLAATPWAATGSAPSWPVANTRAPECASA